MKAAGYLEVMRRHIKAQELPIMKRTVIYAIITSDENVLNSSNGAPQNTRSPLTLKCSFRGF